MTFISKLRPNPISSNEYHDYKLASLCFKNKKVNIDLESTSGDLCRVGLIDVAFFVATDVMEGNTVDYIMSHRIDDENISNIFDEISCVESDYVRAAVETKRAGVGSWLGLTFLGVRSSYGAYINAIVGEIVEDKFR